MKVLERAERIVVISFMDGSLFADRFDQSAFWHLDAARGPSTPSLDYLVGEAKQIDGQGKPQRLGGLEVDDELKLVRPLDGQIAGFRTLEDAINVACRLPHLVKARCCWRCNT